MICLLLAVMLQAPSAPTLSLADAWRTALQRRGLAASARAGIAGASAGVHVAGQIPNPAVSVSRTGSPPRGHVLVDQPLSWMLTRGADQDVARALLTRSRVDSTLLLARLGAEVRRAFYDALGREARHRLLAEQQGIADSVVRIARRRYQAGDVSQFEVEQVELESRLQSQLLHTEADEAAVSRATLSAAIGWPDADLPPLTGELDDGLGTGGIGTDSDPELPAVRAAQADSSLAALSVRSAERARIPFPSIELGAEWDDPTDPGHSYAVLGLAIPVPLWNRGGAQVTAARARADQAAAQVVEARLTSRQTIASARIRLDGTAARARFARDSLLPAAEGLRTRALAAYRAGETGLVPVLDALRREREVQLAGIDALLAFQDAAAVLDELLGRTP